MRNYVEVFVGRIHVKYFGSPPQPDPLSEFDDYQIAETQEALNSFLFDAIAEFPSPTYETQVNMNIKAYALLNKNHVYQLLADDILGFLNGDYISTESPRKTWSNGH